jgi:hypothetical protein
MIEGLIVAASMTLASLPVSAESGPMPRAPDRTLGVSMMSAMVRGDGTTAVGAGVVASERAVTGFYRVTFVRSLTGCTFLAGISTAGDAVAPGNIITTRDPGAPSNIVVQTFSSGTTHADRDFAVMVFCTR